jgi:hypothetical protein
MIENGFVHLPKEAAWRAEYLHELTVFPNGKVDSTARCSTGSSAAAAPSSDAGIWHFYKERYEAQQAGPSRCRGAGEGRIPRRAAVERHQAFLNSSAYLLPRDYERREAISIFRREMGVRSCRFRAALA